MIYCYAFKEKIINIGVGDMTKILSYFTYNNIVILTCSYLFW